MRSGGHRTVSPTSREIVEIMESKVSIDDARLRLKCIKRQSCQRISKKLFFLETFPQADSVRKGAVIMFSNFDDEVVVC